MVGKTVSDDWRFEMGRILTDRFMSGTSMRKLAQKHHFTILSVEDLIRQYVIVGAKRRKSS